MPGFSVGKRAGAEGQDGCSRGTVKPRLRRSGTGWEGGSGRDTEMSPRCPCTRRTRLFLGLGQGRLAPPGTSVLPSLSPSLSGFYSTSRRDGK